MLVVPILPSYFRDEEGHLRLLAGELFVSLALLETNASTSGPLAMLEGLAALCGYIFARIHVLDSFGAPAKTLISSERGSM